MVMSTDHVPVNAWVSVKLIVPKSACAAPAMANKAMTTNKVLRMNYPLPLLENLDYSSTIIVSACEICQAGTVFDVEMACAGGFCLA
jgi:hypothetical protein